MISNFMLICTQHSKPKGKRQLGRPRRRWEGNIRMDLKEIGWKCVNWKNLAQDRDQRRALVNTELNLRVPLKAGNFLNNCATISFSRRTLLLGVSSLVH
jgi:hypothetical protein